MIVIVSQTAKKTNEWVLIKAAGVERELLDTVKARKLASPSYFSSFINFNNPPRSICVLYYHYYYFFDPGQSPRCFKNSRNIKLAEMTINPVDPWKNNRAGELRYYNTCKDYSDTITKMLHVHCTNSKCHISAVTATVTTDAVMFGHR